MATLAPGGRITVDDVKEEIAWLKASWSSFTKKPGSLQLQKLPDKSLYARTDLFDKLQLQQVIRICRKAASLSAAGRMLFPQSRKNKKNSNDADRLRKYLARFGLSWEQIKNCRD